MLEQMCTFLHKLCTLADGGDRGQGNAEQLVVCISAVRGVARWVGMSCRVGILMS